MSKLFADLPEALANSIEIARRCNLALELGKPRLPVFPTPPGMSREEFLRRQAQDGLERRLAADYGSRADEKRKEKYEARLEIELRTIIQMGFAGYFLIVADFINWAKSNRASRSAKRPKRRRASCSRSPGSSKASRATSACTRGAC